MSRQAAPGTRCPGLASGTLYPQVGRLATQAAIRTPALTVARPWGYTCASRKAPAQEDPPVEAPEYNLIMLIAGGAALLLLGLGLGTLLGRRTSGAALKQREAERNGGNGQQHLRPGPR